MNPTGSQPPLDRAWRAALGLLLTAVLLVIAVHLIESVATTLLVIVGIAMAAGFVVWIFRRRQHTRYW